MNAVNYLVKPAAINSSITISGVTVLCKLPRFVSLASIGVISGSKFKGLEPQKIPKACVPAAAATFNIPVSFPMQTWQNFVTAAASNMG